MLGLVEEASGFGSAGILVLIVFALRRRLGGPAAAAAALAGGVGVWIVAHFVLALPYDYLASLGAALGAYLLAAFFEARSAARARAWIDERADVG